MNSEGASLPETAISPEVVMIWLRTVCLVCLCIVLVGCSDNDSVTCPPNDPPPSTYPTTLEPLEEEEVEEILRAFTERNPGVCVDLDEYGLPSRLSLCAVPNEPDVSESEAEVFAEIVSCTFQVLKFSPSGQNKNRGKIYP